MDPTGHDASNANAYKDAREGEIENKDNLHSEVKLKFKEGFDKHMIEVEDVVWKKGKGIVGGHNLENFEGVFKNNGWDVNEYIISKTPHETVEGI